MSLDTPKICEHCGENVHTYGHRDGCPTRTVTGAVAVIWALGLLYVIVRVISAAWHHGRGAALVLLLAISAGTLAAQSNVERTYHALSAQSVPYTPPPEYARWWGEVIRDCGCTPAVELTTIWWRRVSRPTFDCGVHDGCRGSYWPDTEEAFIGADDTQHAKIVKHEMLHAALGGDPDHRDAAWRRDVVMREVAHGEW